MLQSKIRNIAIIAHVDHGKTTLVDQLFKQSGLFRHNQVVEERLMDSMDLERERGITIASKNGSFFYKGHLINVIDTPGHADFGGQVERVLKMADGVLLLVDAAEGPMPQTYFVLKKALALALPVIVVINKIDKPAGPLRCCRGRGLRPLRETRSAGPYPRFPRDLRLREGRLCHLDHTLKSGSMMPLFDMIVESVPAPQGDPEGPLQMLVSSLNYSPFLGQARYREDHLRPDPYG